MSTYKNVKDNLETFEKLFEFENYNEINKDEFELIIYYSFHILFFI